MALYNFLRFSLIVCALAGGYCLHGFGHFNGFFPAMSKLTESSFLYDGSLYDPDFTGIQAFDALPRFLLLYFWPVCDGENPYLTLHCILFAGQFVAAWTATLLESHRNGNRGHRAHFTTLAGLLIQTMGAGLIVPAFLGLQLFTKSEAALTHIAYDSHIVSESALRALPYSIIFGYIVPTVFMSLPSPSILPQRTKIYAILFWQAFPLWVQIIQMFISRTTLLTHSLSTSRMNQRKLHGRAYCFAFSIAVAVHVACVMLCAFVSWTVWSNGVAEIELQLKHFFIPPKPTSSVQSSSIPEGAFWFIQYDYLFSSIAYVTWSSALRYGGKGHNNAFSLWRGIRLFISCFVFGPMATALTLLWERDDDIFGDKTKSGLQGIEDKKSH